MRSKKIWAIILYVVLLGISLATGFKPGIQTGKNLVNFASQMMMVLPFAFILIGLFEVWVPRQTIEKHLGIGSGIKGHLWAVILSAPMVGGLYVAFPMAYTLYKKGAGLGVIFTFLGASSLCRIPMLIFEASFLGVPFSLARLAVSLPLVIGSSAALGRILQKKGYQPKMDL